MRFLRHRKVGNLLARQPIEWHALKISVRESNRVEQNRSKGLYRVTPEMEEPV